MSKTKTVDINKYRHNFILGGLRRLSARWYPRSDAKTTARIERGKYECAMCKKPTPTKEIQLDHKKPVVDPIAGFQGWDQHIERLFVEAEGFQVLCKSCHKVKTKAENAVRAKKCSKCGKKKPFNAFHKRTDRDDGRQNFCKPCSNEKSKQHKAKEGPKELQRDSSYKRKYGITTKEYESMLTKQDNKCNICKRSARPERRLAVDHCHVTGKVRGLLCQKCNMSLGLLKDSEENLKAALTYLKRSRT